MTGPDGWLDMSRFPDHDPDTVLTGDQHALLTSALTVDDMALPDAVWEHMLAVVVGDAEDPGTDAPDDPAVDDDPAAFDDDATWTADLEHTLGLDDHAVADPADDHHGSGDDPADAGGDDPGGEGGAL